MRETEAEEAATGVGQQPDAGTETLERLDVADTLEELRHHIDDLIARLSEKEEQTQAPSRPSTGASSELEHQIEALGGKVESASDLLAELTDILEAQTERIETIEHQLGDPDVEPSVLPPRRGRSGVERDDVPTFSMAPRADSSDALREYLDIRLERLESGIVEIERRIGDVRNLAGARERQVRDLEERLLILVDADDEPEPSALLTSRTAGDARHGTAAQRDTWLAREPREASVQPEFTTRPPHMPLVAHRTVRGGRKLFRRPEPEIAVPGPHDGASAAVAFEPHAAPDRSDRPDSERFGLRDGAVERAHGQTETVASHGCENGAVQQARDHDSAGRMQESGANRASMTGTRRGPSEHNAEPNGEAHAKPFLDEIERLVEREVRLLHDFRPDAADGVRGRKSRPTVLVVDDAADALTVLSIYLSKTGYQVVTATSAEDALAKLRHHDVDAVVLDAKMPGADGSHLCRVLHDDPGYAGKRELPIIVYTGYPEDFPPEVRAEWQAADYVVKGGDMLPLITALVRHTTPNDCR